MPRIRQLTSDVITKIAAGEVIERPASVVKELLENSVDAGATRIEIDIEEGGSDAIRIVDNGCGIDATDLPLAFASHATSKLASADDLFQVGTLGFRGEALASIGGVSQVVLQSRPSGAESGAEITCAGGDLSPVRVWNGAPGTRIEVRNLFFNTPVRRKFLRTTATELGHISEIVTRLALAQRAIYFKLQHNGKLVFEVPGSAELRDRIQLFFGKEVAEPLLAIDVEQGPARLTGFVADPACNRGNQRLQYFFLNGRWIRDRSLTHALQEAYRGLIMVGRYPVAFLFIDLPPDQVDVNVHPTKSEVRFRDAQAVYHLVFTTLRDKLRNSDLVAKLQMPAYASQSNTLRPVSPPAWQPPSPPSSATPTPPPPMIEPQQATEPVPAPPPLPATNGQPEWLPHTLPESKAIQLYDAYLVVETPEGMLVIDQHALHERILYEEWKARLKEGRLDTQRLLVPEPVDLPPEQAAAALENRNVLKQLGLDVSEFGGATVLIHGYPAMLSKGTPATALRSAVEYLTSKDRPPSADQLVDDLLKMMACRTAIKAGDHLGPDEIAALIAQRHLADDTHHCPHGRPTALFFSKHELDRQFKRIG